MTQITIPPEALEAAARALFECDYMLTPDEVKNWDKAHTSEKNTHRVMIRAAFTAMVRNWPGMEMKPTHEGYPAWPHIILPLEPAE